MTRRIEHTTRYSVSHQELMEALQDAVLLARRHRIQGAIEAEVVERHRDAERLVQEAISRLLENRTVLVVAHRLSTVARADQIAVLEAGKLVELGSHDELVSAGGLYQRLHRLEVVTHSE